MVILIRRFFGPCMMASLIAGFILITGLTSLAATPKQSPAVPEDFPVYSVIKPNVDFWIDMFAKYSRGEGVIHDARDLSIRYGVIKLNPENTRRAAKQNREIKEKALDEYEAILLKLAKGKKPSTAKEKKVAALFGAGAKPATFKRAKQNLRIQTGLNQQFKEGIIRSGALVGEFKSIFRSYGLPEDLVYLPCVESSFDVTAYSKFGAAGIWQFTRSTGRMYMKIGYVVDERRDPFIATHAAAKLLKRNFGELKQWSMALTAYNHGLNGMKRAKKKHKSYPIIYTTYRSGSFKFASRNFYSEFLAAREVAKNHTRYFGNIRLAKPVSYTRFKVKGYVPAADLARGLGLPINKIQRLNPALRKPVFDGRKHIPKGYELRLPKNITLDTITRVAESNYQDKQKPSKFHRVQKGDTAGSIARTHKVRLNDLILANGLSRRATIYIGQTLRIPSMGEAVPRKTALAKAKPVTPPVKQIKKVAMVQKAEALGATEPKTAVKAVEEKKGAGATKTVKTVRTPPKPAAIAIAKVDTEPAMPPEAPAVVEAEIKAKPALAATDVSLKIVTSDLKIQKLIEKKTYTLGVIHVIPGETLGHYADWLGIMTQKIRTLNRLPYGHPISVGQAIKLPLHKSGHARFEELRYEFHQEILEDFFDSFFVAGTDTYEVQSGDTLWSLCVNELEIPLWLLQKFNPNMNFNSLHPRQRLVYPLVNPNGTYPIEQAQPLDFRI